MLMMHHHIREFRIFYWGIGMHDSESSNSDMKVCGISRRELLHVKSETDPQLSGTSLIVSEPFLYHTLKRE